MSWKECVDDRLFNTEKVKHAVICMYDGSIWVSSSECPITSTELQVLISKYQDVPAMSSGGLKAGGQKYIYLSSDLGKGVVRGKFRTSEIHCVMTKLTYIFCVYEGPIKHEEIATILEKVGDYLASIGY